MRTFDRETIKQAIKPIVSLVATAEAEHTETKLTKNTLDCFGALLDSAVQQINLNVWKAQEKARQVQKTKQNAIGDMHERILATLDGVLRLPVGNVYDIRCDNLKIIAEIKNKWNTTKGNHKVQIYNDLASSLQRLDGYTAYYVEILPKTGQRYNKPFIPSDNRKNRRVEAREDIRQIDGRSFYELLAGRATALDELYIMLPSIIAEILADLDKSKYDQDSIKKILTGSDEYKALYNKIYGTKI